MKKRLKLVITIVAAVLIICLLVWRFWPHPVSSVVAVGENTITSLWAYGMFYSAEKGHCDLYTISGPNPKSSEPGEIMEILAMSEYQQDFRNLLPWDVLPEAGNSYDGNAVGVDLFFQDKQEYIRINFFSHNLIVVITSEQPNMRIYHPTNSETFYKLVEYLRVHGVLQ